MYACPTCGKQDVGGRAACECGADLSLLACLAAVADAWFNRGLDAVAQDDAPQALEWFAACCASRPTDGAAWLAVAKVWLRLRQFGAARRALERAAEISPDLPDVRRCRRALDRATRPSPDRAARPLARKTAGSRARKHRGSRE